MSNINTIYDISYFDAENNEYGVADAKKWWSSKHRFAVENGTETSEYVEIDLTKRRSVNYISFDIIRKPIDIEIQYDSVDLESIDQYSLTPRWKPVSRIGEEAFDASVSYLTDFVNPWQHCEFYFRDADGQPLITRRLRIKFTRRQDTWPTENFENFAWSIDVKNLRVGRFVTAIEDTFNTQVEVSSYSQEKTFYSEIRQRFVFESKNILTANATVNLSNIDQFSTTDIYPNLNGFDFLIKPTKNTSKIKIDWALFKITGSIESLLDSGSTSITVSENYTDPALSVFIIGDSEGEQNSVSHVWANIKFNQKHKTSADAVYEIRLRNVTPQELQSVYLSSPSQSHAQMLLVANENQELENQENASLTYRLVTDTGNYGKDLLGNEYREGVRYNSADQAVDGKLYTNWTSAPNPSQDGVEALYLDVRKLVAGQYKQSVIDAIEINALTPGVKMNVYYSNQEMASAPQNLEDWENVLWTPIRASFKLNDKQTIDLPYPISAKWICLEFYNLQPFAFNVSNYPILPEVEYKEFPLWVYNDNPEPIKTNDQAILQKEVFVDYSIPEVFTPSKENAEGLRIYAQRPETLDQNISKNGFGNADPEILAKVSFSKNPFITPSVKRVDTSSTLGGHVFGKYINDDNIHYIAEAQQYPRIVESRNVSNVNDRREFARYGELSLLFNRICAHQYAVKKGRFNKKAYNVSISEIHMLRKDYSVEFDDEVIHDVLVFEDAQESLLIEESSWIGEERISIPVGSAVYVTYTIGDTTYEDELVTFEPATSSQASFQSVDLAGVGGIATSAIARSKAFKQGRTYYRDQDFLIVYDPVRKKNQIKRYDIPARLVVPNVVNSIDRYTAIGAAIINTEVDFPYKDSIELGDPLGILISGLSTMEAEIVPPVTAASFGATTIYATLTDPTG
jgi:hypothetical protein